jgi:Asp/Glu/hydantoin racemase
LHKWCAIHRRLTVVTTAKSSIEVVDEWLKNFTDAEVVNQIVARDAAFVSLNFDDPELKKILPWAGTGHGPGAFRRNA